MLLIGFAPWPMSWYSHLPRQYAQAALDVCRYLEEALGTDAGPPRGAGPPARSRMRRSTYRTLADLRAEFQRTMSEPPSISRRATAWWPAVVVLEQLLGVLGTGERLTVLGRVAVPRAARAVAGLAVVGLAGFEPATSATQTRRASQTALQPVPG